MIGKAPRSIPADSLQGQFEAPYGVYGPPSMFPIPVLRFMKTYGITHEQLASVAVVQREWAAKNPRAMMKDPITVADVLNSRMIAYPFRLLQCCLVTDGGGALILTSADRAKDFPRKPVYIMGTGESVGDADGQPDGDASTPRARSRPQGRWRSRKPASRTRTLIIS
ncbi:thiolase family protein [Bradyrhizobium betae]